MPMYEYGCNTCSKTKTITSSIADRVDSLHCDECNEPMPQILGGVNFAVSPNQHILSTRPDRPFETKRAMTEHMKRNNLRALG